MSLLSCLFIILILVIIFIVIFYILNKKSKNRLSKIKRIRNMDKNNKKFLENKIDELQKENNTLKRTIWADNRIFDFIRCINIPQTPVCKSVEDGKSNICRSRLIDCNRFKLVLENDPIAVERMKRATNRFIEAGKERNPSELTYPIKSWWMF